MAHDQYEGALEDSANWMDSIRMPGGVHSPAELHIWLQARGMIMEAFRQTVVYGRMLTYRFPTADCKPDGPLAFSWLADS